MSLTCVGLTLVRAIATEDSAVYLHIPTSLPHAMLARAQVLVKGQMGLLVWGMLDFRNFLGGQDADPGDVAGVEREKVPYLRWGRAPEGVLGADRRRVRRNLMRRGRPRYETAYILDQGMFPVLNAALEVRRRRF